MATLNPFDLLGDDDNDDPSVLLAAQQHKVAAAVAATTKKSNPAATQPAKAAAKLPTKPLPPSQAVREARSDGGRGGRAGGRGYGRSRGGFNRDYGNTENSYGNDSGAPRSYEGGDSGRNSERRPFTGQRGGSRGGRRGGFNNGEMTDGERPRRTYDRQSGTGRSNDFKRDGAGRGNWGTATDEIAQESNEVAVENETNVAAEKPVNEENSDAKENSANETEEKEEEEKQMTLEEYEKVLEEKRKALQAMKMEERKVDAKEFESMQMIAKKKSEEDIVFIKLGSDKDKRKEAADKEERAKKSLSINEFLKPSEGESFYRSGGRGRGRGRGGPRGGGGGYGGRGYGDAPAPAIADPGQFPSLGGK